MRLVSVAAIAALVLVPPSIAAAQAAPQEPPAAPAPQQPAPAPGSSPPAAPAPQTGTAPAGQTGAAPAAQTGTAAAAQTSEPQAGPLPSARTFTANAGLIFNTVKPDRVADFEQVVMYLQSALEMSTDPTIQAQARGWHIYKASEPGPNNTVLYVFVLDPAVPGADYGLGHILGQAYTDPAKLQEIWKLYTESVTSGGTLLNLGPAVAPAPATSTTPAAPSATTPFAVPDTQPKMLPPDADPNRR